jgi:hypothetical protein
VATDGDVLGGACAKHFTERAEGRCADCGELFCSACLVPPTRKRMPLRCVECALVAAGVRAPGARRASISTMSRTQNRPTSRF